MAIAPKKGEGESPVGTVPGRYVALRDAPILIWDESWEEEHAKLYVAGMKKNGTYPFRLPVKFIVPAGKKFDVEFGERRSNVKNVGDAALTITAVPLTVTVGSTSVKGITFAYGSSMPSIVSDPDTIKLLRCVQPTQ